MCDPAPRPTEPFVITPEQADSYWQLGGLWTVLASARTTAGALTVLEQLMSQGSGPPPHVHERWHEFFYVLDGDIAFQIGQRIVPAGPRALLSIPPGTAHGFIVRSRAARVLNLYTPGGFEEQVQYTGTPAAALTLPPDMATTLISVERHDAFVRRSVELNSQHPAHGVDDLFAAERRRSTQ